MIEKDMAKIVAVEQGGWIKIIHLKSQIKILANKEGEYFIQPRNLISQYCYFWLYFPLIFGDKLEKLINIGWKLEKLSLPKILYLVNGIYIFYVVNVNCIWICQVPYENMK